MVFDKVFIDALLEEASQSPRLRHNFDLRTSVDDSSQRMLNALLPGTKVPIHRHRETTECVFIIKGKLEEVLYDGNGVECNRFLLDASSEYGRGCVIPKGIWHTVVVKEPSVIFESKDGKYMPLSDEDILTV